MKKTQEVFNFFDLNDFKNWMNHQDEQKDTKKSIGLKVESKIHLKKLTHRILEVDKGEKEQVAKDFIENGGKILDEDGKNLLIEVSNGSFFLHKMYVRKSDD
jgi:hypothetical protein